MKVRLQKYLSDAGVASRRRAEELIVEGFVAVNDEIVDTLPAFVDPQKDRVVVKGSRVRMQPLRWFAAHKPKNVVCTGAAREGRLRVVDLLPELSMAMQPVGRLDPEACGLVLMTNDGELANLIARPASQVPRSYLVEVKGRVDAGILERLRKGAYISDGRARAEEALIEHAADGRSVLRIVTYDSYPRLIQRLCAKLGHDVRSLKRVSIGSVDLKRLPEGGVRELSAAEVKSLRQLVAGKAVASKKSRAGRPRKRAEAGKSKQATRETTEPTPTVRRRLVE